MKYDNVIIDQIKVRQVKNRMNRGLKYHSNSLMHVFDMQIDYLKHKEKIKTINKKNMIKNVSKSYKDQIKRINSYHKNFYAGELKKKKDRLKNINSQNKRLYAELTREHERSKPLLIPKTLNNTQRSRSSSRSSFRSSGKQQDIKRENKYLKERISVVESELSKQKMDRDYFAVRQIKKRLQSVKKINSFNINSKKKDKLSLPKLHTSDYKFK